MRSSQYFGGGSQVGDFAYKWGVGINPTINGAEWLRTGNLKAISGYATLAALAPGLTYNVATQAATTPASGTSVDSSVRGVNGSYYIFGNTSAPYWTNGLTNTWSAIANDTVATTKDAFAFGNLMIHLGAASQNWSLNANTGTSMSLPANTYVCGATNSAGTLGVAVAGFSAGSGLICTSANGTSWASQTPSGGTGASPGFAAWQQVSSTFAYLSLAGRIFTTADGYTLTDRGIPANLTAVSAATSAASDYSASIAGVTLFSVLGTYNGVANTPVLIRTTDGVNFAATPWATLLGFKPSSAPRINAQGGVFTAVSNATLGKDAQACVQSTDGATWTTLPVPMNTAQSTSAIIKDIRYMNGAYVVTPDYTNATTTFSVASLAATHVGTPFEFQTANALSPSLSSMTAYLRIK